MLDIEERQRIYWDVVDKAPPGPILDMFSKAFTEINRHENIVAFISGGSDSDTMLDMLTKLDPEKRIRYVYCATGMEYEATKRHLKDLEAKYGIKIESVDPILPIPTCCRKYGVPFWSKRVSEMIYRLQRHNFKWEDKPFEVLLQEYPRCRAALRWWCNEHPKRDNGGESSLNIAYAPYLKEYMVANPPPVPIAAKCCQKAKTEPAAKYEEKEGFDMVCTGLRKSEGGSRAIAFKTCISFNDYGKADTFRPVFWLTDTDKREYKEHYGITYSDCYEVWGMKRTGCPGCPYGKEFEQELELMQKYEPKFYRAAVKIFGASYEYTRGYLRFREEMKRKSTNVLKAEENEEWMQ